MDCYDFWICCKALNEEDCKPNFVPFRVKLRKSYEIFKFNRLICQVVRALEIWEINWMG